MYLTISFQVEECERPDCEVCKPVWMDPAVIASIHCLRNKSFDEVYGHEAFTDNHIPSIQQWEKKVKPVHLVSSMQRTWEYSFSVRSGTNFT